MEHVYNVPSSTLQHSELLRETLQMPSPLNAAALITDSRLSSWISDMEETGPTVDEMEMDDYNQKKKFFTGLT